MARERVQVQGLGDAVPGISPTIQRAGQYSVQVQRAGRNKLMDLADALGQVNPLLQQYGQLQQVQEKIGVERAALVEEQNVIAELKKQKDVDGFSVLATTNRDRAYRDALLKRHINNTMLPSLNLKAQDLVNPEKYRTQQDLSRAIDQTLTDEWSTFVGDVGEGVANSTAGKAMWSMITSPYKNEIAMKYEKARDTFIAGTISDEIGTYLEPLMNRFDEVTGRYVINEAGIEDAVKVFDDRLSENLPHLTKQERSKFLVNNFANQLEGLYASQRYTDAARMLSVLKTAEVNKSRIFNTPTAKDTINPLEVKINNAIEKYADKKDTKKKGVYTNIVTEATKGLLQVTTLEQLEQNPMLKAELMDSFSFNGFGNGNVLTEERKEQAIRDLFDETKPGAPVEKFQVALKVLGREGGEESYNQLMEVKDDIDENFQNAIKAPGAPVVLDGPTKDDIIENPQYGLRKQKQLNPKLTLYEFIKNHPIKFTEFDELRKEFAILDRGSYVYDLNVYKDAKSILDNKLAQVDASIIENEGITDTNDKTMIKSMREAYVDSVISDLEDALIEEAKLPEVLESTNQERDIRSKLNEIIGTNAERYKGQAETFLKKKNIFSEAMTPEEMSVELETEVKLRKTQKRKAAEIIEFKSLEKPKKVTKRVGRKTVVVPEQINFELIKQDRQKMLEGGFQTKKHLRLSLARYGFQSWNPTEAATMLDSAGLSYRDVKLFGSYAELQKTIDRWTPVMYKDIGYVEDSEGNYVEGDPDPLTAEEEKIREEYQSFGLLPLDINYIYENVLDGPKGFEESQLSKLK